MYPIHTHSLSPRRPLSPERPDASTAWGLARNLSSPHAGLGSVAKPSAGILSPNARNQMPLSSPAAPSTSLSRLPVSNASLLETEVEAKRRRIAALEAEQVQRIKEFNAQRSFESENQEKFASHQALQLAAARDQARLEKEESAQALTSQIQRARESSRQIQELEKKNLDTKTALLTEEETNRKLKRQNELLGKEIEDLKRGADRVLQGKVEALSKILDGKDEEIRALREENSDYKARLEQERGARIEISRQADALNSDLSRLQVMHEESMKNREDLAAQVENMSRRLEKELNLRQEMVHAHHEQDLQFEQRLTELSEQLRQKNKALHENELIRLSLQEQMTDLDSDRSRLVAERQQLTEKVENLREKVQVTSIRADALEAKLTQTETFAQSHLQQIDRMKLEMEGLKRNNSELGEKNGRLEERLKELEVDAQRCDHLAETLKVQKATLERQHMDRMQEAHRYEDLLRRSQQLEEQVRRATQTGKLLKEKEEECLRLREADAIQQEKTTRLSTMCQEQEQMLSDLRRELKESQLETQSLFGEKQSLEGSIRDLRSLVSDREGLLARVEGTTNRLQEATNERQALTEQVLHLQAEAATHKAKLSHMQIIEALLVDLKREHQKLTESYTSNESLRHEQEGLISSLEQLLGEKDDKLKELQSQVADFTEQAVEWKQIGELVEDIKLVNRGLEERLRASQAETEQKIAINQKLEAANQQLIEQIEIERESQERLSGEVESVREQLDQAKLELGRQSVAVSEAVKEKGQALAQLDGVHKDLSFANDAADKANSALRALREELLEADQSNQSLGDEIVSLRRSLEASSRSENGLRESLTDTSHRLRDLQAAHVVAIARAERSSMLEGKVDGLESVVLRKQEELHKLESLNAELKHQLNVAEQSLASSNRVDQKLQQFREKCVHLEEELSAVETSLVEKSKELIMKEQQVQRESLETKLVRDALSFEKEKLTSLEKENHLLKSELSAKSQVEGRCSALEQLLDRCKAELRQREVEINALEVALMERTSAPSMEATQESLIRELQQYRQQHSIQIEVIRALEEEQSIRAAQQKQLLEEKGAAEIRAREALSEAEGARTARAEAERSLRYANEKHDTFVLETEAESRRSAMEQNKLFAVAQDYKRRLDEAASKHAELEQKLADRESALDTVQRQLTELQHSHGVHSVELEVASSSVEGHKAHLNSVTQSLLAERQESEKIRRELMSALEQNQELQGHLQRQHSTSQAEVLSHEATVAEYKLQMSNLQSLLRDKTDSLRSTIERMSLVENRCVQQEAELEALRTAQLSLQSSLAVLKSSANTEQSYRNVSDLTAQENEILIAQQASTISRLERQLSSEHAQMLEYRTQLEDTQIELRSTQERMREVETSLQLELDRYAARGEMLARELDEARHQLGLAQGYSTFVGRSAPVSLESPRRTSTERRTGNSPNAGGVGQREIVSSPISKGTPKSGRSPNGTA